MPIIALLLSTLSFWMIYWFVRLGGIDRVHSMFAQRKDEARRAAARERERIVPLRAIDDPRDAAMVLMVLIARAGGDPTREQIAAIEQQGRVAFGFDAELVERMTQARYIASRADGFEQAAGVLSDLFNKCLTRAERLELISMVEAIASLDGPSEAQQEGLAVLKRRIGLTPQR